MKKLLLGALVGVGLGFGTSAGAADLPRYAPPPPAPAWNWSGFYVGGQAGGAWSESFHWLGFGITETFTHEPSSFIGGGHVGAQAQFGWFVIGVEGTYSWASLDSTVNSRALPGRLRTLEIESISTIVGKLGYAWTNWLFYVKGGWALADLDTFAINPATGVSAGTSGTKDGWTLGVGIDYMVTPNWVVGVDFNRYRFEWDRATVATDGTPTRWFDGRTDIWAVTGRVSFLFGGFGGY
jgi:outer membrane immunogenic protein